MKRAPFLCKQSPDRTLEVVILAGSLAWETSRDWRKDPDREDDIPPVVLGPDELADLDNLTIIRPDTLYVQVLRTGDIREEELLKIAVKLAHAGVQMARLMSPDGELLENWTGQLERLRQERPSDILPDHFRLDEEALWFDKLTERRDGESDVQPQRICSPLRPGRPLPRHRLSCLADLPHRRPGRQHHAGERVTSPLPDGPDAGQRRKSGAAHRGPLCAAGGGRRDSDAAGHYGLAGRHGV